MSASETRAINRRPAASALGLLVSLVLASCMASNDPNISPDDSREAQCTDGKCDSAAATGPRADRHVELVHVDGFRPDVFRSLLEAGHLPNFRYLISRGSYSLNASTVDKSETMKVIQSYLTGRHDTYVVGWWQFNREEYRFRNFWLEPAEVLNFALGLDFPLHPTIQDLVRNDGGNLTAGLSLARRGVPFSNYARPYLEGLQATTNHRYYNQARATNENHLDIFRRIGLNGEPAPRFSTLLLAPADEFAHARGVTTGMDADTFCFERDQTDTAIFELIENDANHQNGGFVMPYRNQYFKRLVVSASDGSLRRICIPLPELDTHSSPSTELRSDMAPFERRRALPEYVLAMIQVDIELGYLINTLRSIRYQNGGAQYYEAVAGAPSADDTEASDPSLFDRTLFIITGDHGMVDTPYGMAPPNSEGQAPPGPRVSFIDHLNSNLGLTTGTDLRDALRQDVELGIDFAAMPDRLRNAHRYTEWQDQATQAHALAALNWSDQFFDEIQGTLRHNLHERYWWLSFFRSAIIDPRLDGNLNPIRTDAIDTLAKLYLRGEPAYQQAEREGTARYFDQHVRLVYGGGARNNAELFLPTCVSGECSWSRRPAYRDILSYRGGTESRTTLIDALRATPAVGLIYVRENNDDISVGQPLPPSMRIRVMDRFGREGIITVRRDEETGVQTYHYQIAAGSTGDPLGYDTFLSGGEGTWGTYNEWNDHSVALNHYYHNGVAGVGAYLYSTNPATGDVLVFHSQGWNFGENAGGHGGIHRGEKRTMMLVSGPGLAGYGTLYGRSQYTADSRDGSVALDSSQQHHPTILDIAPTALVWLGYEPDALVDFAQGTHQPAVRQSTLEGHSDFESYVHAWVSSQRQDVIDNIGGVSSLHQALGAADLQDFEIDQFQDRLNRLFEFMGHGNPVLPDYSGSRMDGNSLILDSHSGLR